MTEEEQLVRIETKWARWSHTGTGAAYFSIRSRKFIRPRISWGAETYFKYQLYPGRYVKLEWDWWDKNDPENKLHIELVKISPAQPGDLTLWREERLGLTTFEVNNPEWLPQNPIIRDFVEGLPSYHSPPNIPFDKVYSERDVAELRAWARGSDILAEGEEHD